MAKPNQDNTTRIYAGQCSASSGSPYVMLHLIVGVSTVNSSVVGTPKMVNWFETKIVKHYEITSLGAVNTLTESVMERYSIEKKPTCLPMHPGTVLSLSQSPSTDKNKEYMRKIHYQSLLRALWYAATVCLL